MKTHNLLFSTHFPAKHSKKGMPTGFVNKITKGRKIHTIRNNPDYWEKRLREVKEGKARLFLRHWLCLPYRSKQRTFHEVLAKDIGWERVKIDPIQKTVIGEHVRESIAFVANYDGLSEADFLEWFKGDDGSEKIIIYFFASDPLCTYRGEAKQLTVL